MHTYAAVLIYTFLNVSTFKYAYLDVLQKRWIRATVLYVFVKNPKYVNVYDLRIRLNMLLYVDNVFIWKYAHTWSPPFLLDKADARVETSNGLDNVQSSNTDHEPCYGFFDWPKQLIQLFIKLCSKSTTRTRPNCIKLKNTFKVFQMLDKKEKLSNYSKFQ